MYNTAEMILGQDASIFFYYFLVGAFGDFLMSLLLIINEDLVVQKKHRIIKSKLANIMFLLFELFVSAMIGGTLATVANHNYVVALSSGFFSKFIIVYLVKWVQTTSVKVAFNEVLGGILKEIFRKIYISIEKGDGKRKKKDK